MSKISKQWKPGMTRQGMEDVIKSQYKRKIKSERKYDWFAGMKCKNGLKRLTSSFTPCFI